MFIHCAPQTEKKRRRTSSQASKACVNLQSSFFFFSKPLINAPSFNQLVISDCWNETTVHEKKNSCNTLLCFLCLFHCPERNAGDALLVLPSDVDAAMWETSQHSVTVDLEGNWPSLILNKTIKVALAIAGVVTASGTLRNDELYKQRRFGSLGGGQ